MVVYFHLPCVGTTVRFSQPSDGLRAVHTRSFDDFVVILIVADATRVIGSPADIENASSRIHSCLQNEL